MYIKYFVQDKWAILDPKIAHSHNSGLGLRIFKNFCRLKGTWKFYQLFSRKNFIWGNLIFLGHVLLCDWAWSKLSQANVTIGSLKNSQDMISFMINTGSLNSQDMIRTLKQLTHYSGKHYVMDVVWILYDVYVWRSKFNRFIWFFKVFLRICYISLFNVKVLEF